jgi:acyl carrier protein
VTAPEALIEEIADRIGTWWSELLDIDVVGRDDDFFDIGGTSLTLVRFVTRTQEIFEVELPLAELFADAFTPRTAAAAVLATNPGGGVR